VNILMHRQSLDNCFFLVFARNLLQIRNIINTTEVLEMNQTVTANNQRDNVAHF